MFRVNPKNKITKLRIRNYKSLKDVSVNLSNLQLLVGQNGTGKSSFLVALRMLREMNSALLGFENYAEVLKRRSPNVFDLFDDREDLSIQIDLEFSFLLLETKAVLSPQFGYHNPQMSEGSMNTSHAIFQNGE